MSSKRKINFKEPKTDLGLKIGSKKEKAWTDILNQSKELIEEWKRNILINEEVIKLAKKVIAEEKQNFK